MPGTKKSPHGVLKKRGTPAVKGHLKTGASFGERKAVEGEY